MLYIFNQKNTFTDIIAGLKEGLIQNGITQVKVIKKIRPREETKLDDLYILFGAHDYDGPLPQRYIVYQFEQTSKRGSELTRHWFTPKYLNILRGAYAIWDYSLKNISNLKRELGMERSNKFLYVPLCYMPVLDKIKRVEESERDIDVLFYGSLNPRRMKIFNDLKQVGIKADFNWNNLWEEELDEKISKAKIILNIHFYEEPILESSRLSYLVGNKAFVISEPSVDPILDRQYTSLVKFVEYGHIVETCIKYLVGSGTVERLQFVEKAYENFKTKSYNEVIPFKVLQPYIATNLEDTDDIEDIEDIEEEMKDNKYIKAEIEETADGQILKLPDISYNELPTVSVVTLTYNRSEILPIAVRNFRLFDYPEDKIEWVIIDDSNEYHSERNRKLVDRDPRVNYIHLDQRFSISEKRNMGASESRGAIIVHMDDDDYYPPQSVLARVKLLMKYREKGAGCVGSCQIAIYNLVDNYSYLMSTPYPSEASMAYFKDFWKQRQFPYRDVPEGEGIPFVHKRTSLIIDMPYMFNLIAITHKKNITGKFRTNEIEEGEKFTNFFNLWDFDTQLFFLDILSQIEKEEKRVLKLTHDSE